MKELLPLYEAVFCDHMLLTPCCEPDCGHYSCPCGIYWDDGAESEPFWEDDEEDLASW